jgi:hypothetical protein
MPRIFDGIPMACTLLRAVAGGMRMQRGSSRAWLTLLAAAAVVAIPGCAVDDRASSASDPPDVTGAYRAHSEGPLEELLLGDGQYAAASRACDDGRARCTSEGTYVLSPDRASIELTDAATGSTRTLPFAVIAAGAPRAGQGALGPRGLCLVGHNCPGDRPAEPSSEALVTPAESAIVIQCTGNCAVTIRVGDQVLESTGQSLTVTVPAAPRR